MTPILHCQNQECPKDWDKLATSGETKIRVCTECLKAVYLCENAEEARMREEAGQQAVIR